MRIGVVSDTHNHLRNVERIAGLLIAAGVDRVVHTGDVTKPGVLERLARIGRPLHGVYGNNDEREALRAAAGSLGITLAEPPLELHWHGRSILVVHDPADLAAAAAPHHELLLHGHTHRRRIERSGSRLVFNPGECAGHLAGHNAVGVVDLGSLDTELLRF